MGELFSSFDQPLKIAHDQMVGKDHLLCDPNRVGDSYRSTWSNQYEPFLDGGTMPIEGEEGGFDQYSEMYFEGGVSSVYFWDLDDGFVGVILIKNS